MKKLFSLLLIVIGIGFIASLLYIAGIPPFNGNPGAKGTQQTSVTQATSLPDFLTEEKIARSKTYEEYINRGKLLEDSGYANLAIAEYQEANKLNPDNAEPFIKIGRIHLLNGEFEQAQGNFEQALKIKPDSLDTLVYLGRTLLRERKITEAKTVFDKISVDNQTTKYYQGIISAYFGDYDQSKQLLKRSLEIGTSGDISKKAKNFLNAFSEFDSNQGGEKIHLKTLLARSYDQTGEYQMAIPLLFDVIKEKKDYRDAWILLGYAYLSSEKYHDAIDAFTEAKKVDPQKAETFFFLGLSYYGLNDLQQAAQNLEQAKKNGFQPVIQIDQKLAEIYLELQQYDKAAYHYEKVIALNDQNTHFYVRPIWLYLEKLNQPDKAITLARRAVTNHPNDAMSYNLLGWALISKDPAQAESNLKKALALDPGLDAVYLNFGKLMESQGQLDQALAYYYKAHRMGNGNAISNSAAEHYNIIIAKMETLNPNSIKADLLQQ